MINLLPDDLKTEILYGRRNWWLAKRLAFAGLGVMLLVLFAGVGVVYAKNTEKNIKAELDQSLTEVASPSKLASSTKVKSVGADLKLINAIFKKEVRLSYVLEQIASVMPSGSVLGNITLAQVQDPAIQLTVQTTSQELTGDVTKNFTSSPNSPFKQAFANSVTCDQAGARYRCSVNITATFKDNILIPKTAPAAQPPATETPQ